METAIYLNGKRCNKNKFKYEEELESLMEKNYKLLFGNKTIFIQKSKIKTEGLGDSIPDGFLVDLRDANNPQIYLIEVELEVHDFYRHIFPQITKFIAFFNSSESRKRLIEKLFETVLADKKLEEVFRALLGSKEIFKALTDAVENTQNILLILDEEKPEIWEAKRAYAEWDRLVKVGILNAYKKDKEEVLSLTPPFEEVDVLDVSKGADTERYDENFHMESSSNEIVDTYRLIKEKMLSFDKNLTFNPKHYYISIIKNTNFAYIKLRRTKMHIVVMLPYAVGRRIIKKHKISKLSQSVKDFYHGPCFRVTIENKKNLSEIIKLLKRASK